MSCPAQVRGGGRLLLQPLRQQLAVDRRQPGASGPGNINARARLYQTAVVPAPATSSRWPTSRASRRTAGAATTRSRPRSRSATRRASRCSRRTRGRRHAGARRRLSRTPTTSTAEVAGPRHGSHAPLRRQRRLRAAVRPRPTRSAATGAACSTPLLGGWSVSPIVTVTSGAPLNLTVNGNPSNSSGTDRPNVVGDWRARRSDGGTVVQHGRIRGQRAATRSATRRRTCCVARATSTSTSAAQVVPASPTASAPTSGSNRSTPPTAVTRQPQHAGRQRQLRPHLVGRRRPQQPGRAQAFVLGRRGGRL